MSNFNLKQYFKDFDENDKLLQSRHFNTTLFLTSIIYIYFIIKFNFMYHYGRFNLEMIGCFMILISIKHIVFKYTKNLFLSIFLFYFFFMLLADFLILLTGGFKAAGSMWLAVLPFIGTIFLGRRGLFWGVFFLVSIILSFIVFEKLNIYYNPYRDLNHFYREFKTNLIIFSIFSISLSFTYVKNEHKNKVQLIKAIEKNENLLRILFHDLANPIQSISLINRKLLKDQNEDYEKRIIQLNKLSDRVNEILQSVKKNKALEDGKIVLDLRPILLHDSIEKVRDIFEMKLADKNIQLKVINDSSDTQAVLVDNVYFIHQVLGNIISNAIKFSPSQSEILFSWRKIGNELEILIEDFGIGIPEEILKELFETRKNMSRQGTAGEIGTGYGMPLVRAFVEQFRGTLEIKSTIESHVSKKSGTQVYIRLPFL
jgi:signal transduction histidine kinase